MKRTRRWEFVKQDAVRFAQLGLSDIEIGQRLQVDRATVFRWRKAGKLPVGRVTEPRRVPVAQRQTPAQWAAAVRADYDLDATDDQIVTMAESVLLTARDPQISAALRLAAMREFRGAVKQLGLVTRAGKGEQAPATPEPPKREQFPAQRRTGVDPRAVLSAVK